MKTRFGWMDNNLYRESCILEYSFIKSKVSIGPSNVREVYYIMKFPSFSCFVFFLFRSFNCAAFLQPWAAGMCFCGFILSNSSFFENFITQAPSLVSYVVYYGNRVLSMFHKFLRKSTCQFYNVVSHKKMSIIFLLTP